MDQEKQTKLLGGGRFWSSDWAKAGGTKWARQRVFTEFSHWVAGLRNSRLAKRSGQLWHMLRAGGLTRADMAAVVGALLYCISPIDLAPDAIPILGYFDDMFVVMTVLSYLKNGIRIDVSEIAA